MHVLIDEYVRIFSGYAHSNAASEWPCQRTITRQLCICLWSFQHCNNFPPSFLDIRFTIKLRSPEISRHATRHLKAASRRTSRLHQYWWQHSCSDLSDTYCAGGCSGSDPVMTSLRVLACCPLAPPARTGAYLLICSCMLTLLQPGVVDVYCEFIGSMAVRWVRCQFFVVVGSSHCTLTRRIGSLTHQWRVRMEDCLSDRWSYISRHLAALCCVSFCL